MHYYEILEIDGIVPLPARLGWVESAEPISITQAARALIEFVPRLAHETGVEMREEMALNAPDFKLWVCSRPKQATLAVFEWPEDGAGKEIKEYHKIFKVSP